MPSPLQQLTFTSNKDQDRQVSVDVSDDGHGAKQVSINVYIIEIDWFTSWNTLQTTEN